ncbi:hypothetical protein [Alicyclobacillus ferrooxydans]|uniref:DUF5659 domain-containing protein n=1 Tax=Alicyclobacillus ferrooxydans TaxID=471514 RepID=A0A0P9CS78_9BACL|nr:hypothetical protein [Alicyclobacillus ferrooxydans]KPV45678.1 hypothetical protein AN477_01870 [Alicyclobacillus ferrooxydans]
MNTFITMTKDTESAYRAKRFLMKRGIPCEIHKRRDGRYLLFTDISYRYAIRNVRRQMSA